MQTGSKFGFHPSLFLTHTEPKNVKQALADSNWVSAMQQEYAALRNNHS